MLRNYILSIKALGYWISIAVSASAMVAVFTIPEGAYPIVYLRSILGMILLLFLPGYELNKFLYFIAFRAKNNDLLPINNIEQIALAIGMSIALTSLIGFGFNYTPFGVRSTPITLCLFGLAVAFATIDLFFDYKKNTKAIQDCITESIN